ncbi:hypothetical protein C2G38_2217307 [Gigaspora rosea]|uniref:Uncharacterized protein n=1 Tax=Gigaspora rosea TaxID=44941 RepID=A0A397U9I1_9GLOM|nr:hypothetical protein C2G38_2217307 [Gigaspora rosea]
MFLLLNKKGDKYNLDYDAKWATQKSCLAKNTIPILLEAFGEQYNTNRNELLDMLQQKLKSKRSYRSLWEDSFRTAHFEITKIIIKLIEQIYAPQNSGHSNTYNVAYTNMNNFEKMSRRAEAFRYLHSKKDLHITSYDLAEIKKVLGTNEVHSPEFSDDELSDKGKEYVNIYELLWRSEELHELLHNILDTTIAPVYIT